MTVRKFLGNIPKLLEIKNADKIGALLQLAFDKELKGEVFQREEGETFESRCEWIFNLLNERPTMFYYKDIYIKLIKLAYLSHEIKNHGKTEDEEYADLIVELTKIEELNGKKDGVLTVEEAVAGVWS